MTYIKKTIIYLLVPPILVIGLSIWLGAAIKTDTLTPDEKTVMDMEHRPVTQEIKEVEPELKPLKDIFYIKKKMELPSISEVIPQPEKEKEDIKKEEKAEPKVEKTPHNLMLILIMENKKIAMVDGKTLKEGDTLADNSIIKSIEANRVLIINGQNEEWLSIR